MYMKAQNYNAYFWLNSHSTKLFFINELHECTKFKLLCHIHKVDNSALLQYLLKSKL